MRGVRQTVGGIVYDTEEAEFVASACEPDEDEVDLDVSLFRTVDHHWFLALQADSRSRGSVTPLTELQARQWCEDHHVDPKIVRFYFRDDPAVDRTLSRAALLRPRATGPC